METVIQSSESAYPELREHDAYIKKVIGTEEANFARTIDAGMNILNNMIDGLEKAHQHLLKGLDVFKLNDTFGFPLDLTKEIAAEQGIEIDEDGFHAEMKKQKERARAERLKKNISGWSEDLFGGLTAEPTEFAGYDTLNEQQRGGCPERRGDPDRRHRHRRGGQGRRAGGAGQDPVLRRDGRPGRRPRRDRPAPSAACGCWT